MVVVLGGCGFAQKHPGVTIGVVTGTLGFGICGLSVDELGTCAAVGGIAGAVLGGITGLVTTFADTSAHELKLEDERDGEFQRANNGTPPPPGLPDGGLGGPVDAGVPAVVDAGGGQLDAAH